MNIKNINLQIYKADVIGLEADVLVNPTNNQMKMESDLALSIKECGGQYVERDAANKGPVGFGEAIVTDAGSLKFKHIIHVALFGMDGSTDEYKIRVSCRNALLLASQSGAKTIVFPPLGCGRDHFSAVGSAKIMAQEILKFSRAPKSVKKIMICSNQEELITLYEKTIVGYLEHIQNNLSRGPYVTVDVIIELPEGIILIERSNPPFGWALPGGFLDQGESLEQAVRREAQEETHMELEHLRQFHTYSEPDRDPRFHTVSTVFVAQGKGTPQSGDDAKGLNVVAYKDLLNREYAFDHKKIIRDYLIEKENKKTGQGRKSSPEKR